MIPPLHRDDLAGKTLYIPRMGTTGAECLAAALRQAGMNAVVSPRGDEDTLKLASRFTTGEECLPQRVVLGNFLKVLKDPSVDTKKVAFFLPTSSGPCRFGQYAPLLRKILDENGWPEIPVFAPTSSNAYDDIALNVRRFQRTAWRAIIVSDILRKALWMVRPYARDPGKAEAMQERALARCCTIFEDPHCRLDIQMVRLVRALREYRDALRNLTLKAPMGSCPLIGVLGEIFLRLNSYSNQDLVRRLESQGAECWMADIGEWIWYTHWEQIRKLRDAGQQWSREMLFARIRGWIQHSDERRLLSPFSTLFRGRKELSVTALLERSDPYLPHRKALGEMTLNAGKAIAYFEAGCDGVIDISPFTCMNGIVSEAFYPAISRDHNHIPIRIMYFDGVPVDLDGHLEMFLELVKEYRRKRFEGAESA